MVLNAVEWSNSNKKQKQIVQTTNKIILNP